MKIHYYKILIVFFMMAFMGLFTHCGNPFKPTSDLTFQTNTYTGGTEASYEGFSKTVYPITRARCVSCHSTTQPTHASDDMKTAHDAVMNNHKVNFSNIPASRLVAKLRDENHNCWSNCSNNALEMQKAIEEWSKYQDGKTTTPSTVATYTTEETDTLENELNDPANPLKSNSIKLNIQAAMLKSPMTLSSPAGSDFYISVPTNLNTTLTSTDTNAGTANFNFQVPTNGTYKIWGLAHGPSDADNSFYINIMNLSTNRSVSGGPRQWDIPVGPKFDWRQAANLNIALTAGTNYSLELKQREDGSRLSGFVVTMDPDFNGQETNDYFGVTLVFDISNATGIADAKFMIDVIDYDLYSYKFSKPRIVASSNIYVKGLKLLLNNQFNPQHSSYTVVDKIISPTDNLLSQYSMVVMKDKGSSSDHVKFSFDELSQTNLAGGSNTTGTAGNGAESSLSAFQGTVYPISRSSAYSCVNCHTSVSPRHASDNTISAHDAALSIVDFANPANSRVVLKMKNERHNCQNFCDSIAAEYVNAIQGWKTRSGR